MKNIYWDTWSKDPNTEKTKLRVLKKLPVMECTTIKNHSQNL